MPSLVTEDRAVNYKTLGFIIIPLRFYISGYSEFKVIPLIKNIKWFLYLVLEGRMKVMKHTSQTSQRDVFGTSLGLQCAIWVQDITSNFSDSPKVKNTLFFFPRWEKLAILSSGQIFWLTRESSIKRVISEYDLLVAIEYFNLRYLYFIP